MAVPDFLSTEQQQLYRRAYRLYSLMFGGDTHYIDYFDMNEYAYLNDTVEYGAHTYQIAVGRYADWADFIGVIHSVFTDRYWQEKNLFNSVGDIPYSIYMEYDGLMAFISAARGSGGYNENFPDKFKLISQTDDTIEFTVTGHYNIQYLLGNESPEDRNDRFATSYEYTLTFPIRMVLTDDGWRFDEFHSARADDFSALVDSYVVEEDGSTRLLFLDNRYMLEMSSIYQDVFTEVSFADISHAAPEMKLYDFDMDGRRETALTAVTQDDEHGRREVLTVYEDPYYSGFQHTTHDLDAAVESLTDSMVFSVNETLTVLHVKIGNVSAHIPMDEELQRLWLTYNYGTSSSFCAPLGQYEYTFTDKGIELSILCGVNAPDTYYEILKLISLVEYHTDGSFTETPLRLQAPSAE